MFDTKFSTTLLLKTWII